MNRVWRGSGFVRLLCLFLFLFTGANNVTSQGNVRLSRCIVWAAKPRGINNGAQFIRPKDYQFFTGFAQGRSGNFSEIEVLEFQEDFIVNQASCSQTMDRSFIHERRDD